MEKQPHNIQDVFLNHLRREKLPVTVFLMSGVKLTGRIKSFDKYAVILESGQREQLIFKHAISTVVTTKSAPAAAAPSAPSSKPPSTTTKASDPEPSD
ncbi:MAG: RNA chaperone Hfq [Acidobacteria bacterium]|nr:RNA chaperone Hfq [Acidobacteriota bacterium]